MKPLLIGFNTRALAESAAGAGCSFVSLDCFGDLDHALLGPVYSPRKPLPGLPAGGGLNMERLVEWGIILARRNACDSLVYASGLENRPELVSRLLSESGCQLCGNSPSSLQQVRDPVVLGCALRQAGYNAPLARLAESRQPDGERRWLVKPLKSGGGRGVAIVSQGDAIPEGSIYQEYIDGSQCSLTFVADGKNCCVLGITEQLTGTSSYNGRDFGYAGSLFPLETSEKEQVFTAVDGIVRWLTVNYGLRGLNGVDFIVDGGGDCWVIEVNPRYSASMELLDLAYGISLFKLHLLACSGGWREVQRIAALLPVERVYYRPGRVWGKKVIYTKMRAVVRPQLPGWQFGQEREWALQMHAYGLRDLPFPEEVIPAGNPVATAVACGETRVECLERLDMVCGLMRNQLSPAP